MKVTICIGSSCHIKGSRQVVEELQHLIAQHQLQDKNGVSVTVDGTLYSVSPETVDAFFQEHVLAKA